MTRNPPLDARLRRRFSLKARAWKLLCATHRWLGIASCILFVLWFASGLVMMYVAFPELTREERLQRLPAIDWNRVHIAPDAVLRNVQPAAFPQAFQLEMLGADPVYRVQVDRKTRLTISAESGKLIEGVDAKAALQIAVAAGASVSGVTTLERDQWSIAQGFDAHRPLHRVELEDPAAVHLYISSTTGEIVLDTNARERIWNWAGSVVHWLYFSELRARPALWSQVVLWTSGAGILVAASGLWLGIDRLRRRRGRAEKRRFTPYRGWMAWHHLAGLVGGLFVLTWVFSGWLSMDPPVPWAGSASSGHRAAAAAAFAGAQPGFPGHAGLLHALAEGMGEDVRVASFMWSLGEPKIVLTDGAQRIRVIDAATLHERQLPETELIARAAKALPHARMISAEHIDEEDAYWYSRNGARITPVLRFVYDDAERTWLHVDPRTGQVLGLMGAGDRTHRWLFSALHTFDFRWMLMHPPVREALVWLLSIAGLGISISGLVIGWRRLRR